MDSPLKATASAAAILLLCTPAGILERPLSAQDRTIVITRQPGAPPAASPVAARPPSAPEDLGSISGRVLSALTGEPVRKATVQLDGRAPSMPFAWYTIRTDDSGRFDAKGLEPGNYKITTSGTGFLRDLAGKGITLSKGQNIADVELRLTPSSVIAGQVRNAEGEPMPGYRVTPCVYRYVDGRRTLVEAQGSPQSDDTGEYRLSGLPAGRYILLFTKATSGGDSERDRSAKPRREDYVETFYPGTSDPGAAVPVEVAAGQILDGMDVTIAKARVVTVAGRVVNQTGLKDRSGLLSLKNTAFEMWGTETNMGPQGDFEFRGIHAGTYRISVDLLLEPSRWTRTRQTVLVGEDPMENVRVGLNLPATIPGSLRMEGEKHPDLKAVKIGLRLPGPRVYGYVVEPASPADDGTFRFSEVQAERYFLEPQNLPEGFYVKSARFGDADALEAGVDATQGARPLEVVLAGAAAAVSGSVKNASDSPAVEATVALVPQEAGRQGQPYFYRAVSTDSAGAFRIDNLPPGEYRIYAWSKVEGGAWMNAQYLKPLEGKSVTLRESGSQTLELRAIAEGR